MIFVIDNYDSFTYNLVQFIGELGADPVTCRNDATTPAQIAERAPKGMIVSPGPCTPKEAGISVEAVRELSGSIPILGVCLGHQSITAAFGGVVACGEPVHGKSSMVYHDAVGIFAGLESPFSAGRYHSLFVEPDLPAALRVTARTQDGLVMGIEHCEHSTFGVQFHPESILTPTGPKLLQNFLKICGEIDS